MFLEEVRQVLLWKGGFIIKLNVKGWTLCS